MVDTAFFARRRPSDRRRSLRGLLIDDLPRISLADFAKND
jgi:hypothetical protein